MKPSPSTIAKSDVPSLPARQCCPSGSARILRPFRLLGIILDPLNGFSMCGPVQLGHVASIYQVAGCAHTRKPKQPVQALA